MKSFLLKPSEILPQTHFIDALMWVAFEKYPEEFDDINSKLTKEFVKSSDFEDINKSYFFILEFFTKEICEKYGLPENIELSYFEEDKDMPMSPSVIEAITNDKNSNAELATRVKQELPLANEFEHKKQKFFDAIANHLQEAKYRIYAAIKESRLRLYGIEHYIKDEVSYTYHKDLQFDQIPLNKIDFQGLEVYGLHPIQLLCPDRDKNHKGTYFDFLMVSTEDLFKHFPPKKIETKQVKYIHGAYILDDTGGIVKQSSVGGRKPAISDKELMQISIYLTKNADKYAGQKQEYVVSKVIEWFSSEFGRNIPYQTMRGRIAEFIKTLTTKTES